MSYDPLTGLVYIPTYDDARNPTGTEPVDGRLVAWDPMSQRRAGRSQHSRPTAACSPPRAGWCFRAKARANSMPRRRQRQEALVDPDRLGHRRGADQLPGGGEQYILIPVGWARRRACSGRQRHGDARIQARTVPLLAFKLGGTMPFPYPKVTCRRSPHRRRRRRTARPSRGRKGRLKAHLWRLSSPEANGSGHGGVNGTIPDLRYMPARCMTSSSRSCSLTHLKNGMPGFGVGAGFPLTGTKMSVADADPLARLSRRSGVEGIPKQSLMRKSLTSRRIVITGAARGLVLLLALAVAGTGEASRCADAIPHFVAATVLTRTQQRGRSRVCDLAQLG